MVEVQGMKPPNAEVNPEDLLEWPVNSRTAAPLFGLHYKTLERMARRGEVPATKLGKSWQFRMSRLSSWFDARLDANVVKQSPQTNKKEDET